MLAVNEPMMNAVVAPMNARRQAGFTLIELLVVIALISIMLDIAVPSFTSFISNYRATSAINDFLQGVNLTRNEALKRGRRVMMMPNDSAGTPSVTGNWKYGWTIFVDTNNNQVLDIAEITAGNLIYKHALLDLSIAVSNSGGGASAPFTDGSSRTYVSFDGTGYPRQLGGGGLAGGIVMIDTTGPSVNRRTLCLAVLGRPRIVKDVVETCSAG